jgi:hypothetical protein
VRWQRPEPMQLWQIDIVDGGGLVAGVDTKIITGVDDHSRFCVMAKVVPRATGRAVCLVLVEAFRRYGIPDEGPHGQRHTVHGEVRPGRWGDDVRSDLPGERGYPSPDQAEVAHDDGEDRALPVVIGDGTP